MIIVVMGVSGSGKTTVGEALAAALGWPFIDADTLHTAANVARMRAGIPLEDADRWPWLDSVVAALRAVVAARGDAVLACSALKEAYRERLRQAGDVRFVHLAGDYATLAARVASRQHRYMPASLLASQCGTLEVPADALALDVCWPVAQQVSTIAAWVRDAPSRVPAP